MKKLMLIGTICLFVASGFAYYQYNKPHKNVSKLKAEYILSANELYSAFEENEELANENYLNKVIEVRGVIRQIQIDDAQYSILLNASHDGFGLVNCALKQKKDLNKYSIGDAIVVKGICSGYLMDVVLTKCVIKN